MNKKYVSLLLVLVLCITCGLTAFADTLPYDEYQFTDSEGNYTHIIKRLNGDSVDVEVYLNGKLDHKARVNSKANRVELIQSTETKTFFGLFTTKKLNSDSPEISKVSDYVTENKLSAVSLAARSGSAWRYVEGHTSNEYHRWGELWKNYSANTWEGSEKHFSITKGTTAGIVVGILAAFLDGGVTLTVLLSAMGSGIVGGLLGSYVDSKCYYYYKSYDYQVRDKSGTVYLSTDKEYKTLRVYDYNNREETLIDKGQSGGFRGSNYEMIEAGIWNYLFG